MSLVVTFACAAAAVWLLSFPVVRWLCSRQVLDRPNERSSHAVPTPRGGGLAVICVIIPALLGLHLWWKELFPLLLAVCMVMLAAISFVDDLRPLKASVRFSIHLAAAVLLICGLLYRRSGGWAIGGNGAMDGSEMLAALFFCVYLVGYTNAFNFMDGINGISGMQAFMSGTGVTVLALLVDGSRLQPVAVAGALVAGAAVGFLPHNFPKARVFMGDVGSVPIGFVTAALWVVLTLKAGLWLVVPMVLIHLNYIFDTGITLVRRVFRGEKWYLPHREHFYQRLVRSGKTHTCVTLWEATLQLLTMGATVGYIRSGTPSRIALASIVILMWLGFFTWAEVRFRASQTQEAGLPKNLAPGTRS